MNFFNKVALVTGGAGGIGARCVKELLKNNIKGVVIADIDSSSGEKISQKFNDKYGSGKTIYIKTNVADKHNFGAAFQKTIQAYGNLDIVLNNAGIVDEINWERATEINLKGTTFGCLLAINDYLPKYKSSSEAYIINISSVAGLYPADYIPHYAATKHAVVGLSKSFGVNEVIAKEGVCVMCLCPGPTDTVIFNNPVVVYRELRDREIKKYKFQRPESVAKSVIEMLDRPENGSVWLINKNILRKLNISPNSEYSYEKSF